MRIPGKIPIKISPFFYVTAGLIGWLNSMGTSRPIILVLLWIVVIFVSILVHEFGHALTARFFGQNPRIELVALGGLTVQEGKPLRGWREFLVVLNGPLFGFFLFFLSLMLLNTGWFTGAITKAFLQIFIWVNLFWTLVNLVPVLPLDGGQLLRVIFESIWGGKGLRYALFCSMILAGSCAFFFFFVGYFLVGAIFFLFAFQNLAAFRKARIMTDQDRSGDFTLEFKEIEDLLNQNQKEEAIPRLEKMREKTKRGVLYNMATEHLAALRAEEGNFKAVYELLTPLKKHLGPEATLFLHKAAYLQKDFSLALELSGPCFQHFPDPEVALRSAEAAASLKEIEATIGWLKAAHQGGIQNLKEVIEGETFAALRDDPDFEAFLRTISKTN